MSNVAMADSTPRPIIDVARRAAENPLPDVLRAVIRQSGMGPADIVRAYARLAFGAGRISFTDFIRLRLFDRAFHGDTPLDTYVGQRRNRDLCVEANHRHDWLGLLTNKVASTSYLAAYGLPTIPIKAIYAPGASVAPGLVLSGRKALARFLTTPDHFPLFGKPVEGSQSLGSVGLRGCTPVSRTLERMDGTSVALEQFVAEIEAGYPAGYMFQPLTTPHPAIAAVCGARLATVRIVTISGSEGPRVFRVAWKIPAGANVADNFWRVGNLLGQIDIPSGRVGSVVSGTGPDMVTHARHPDTGAELTGFCHPQWEAMKAVAVEGARLMRHVPLIGWDIACTDHGPVIVEMNETPDLFLVQFADRRGVLDGEFKAFLAHQRAIARDARRSGRATIARL